MAISKFPLLSSVVLALIFTKVTTEISVSETATANGAVFEPDGSSDSSLKIELGQLKSKLSLLESNIDGKTRELKSKDDSIKQLENTIQEKSTSLASLQSEIQLIQEKGSSDAKEQLAKAHARAGELEKQVQNLKREIETQNKKKDALIARADVAEKKIQELNAKLEKLKNMNDEQKTRIRKTERALQIAEEEMMKAKLESSSTSKKLREVQQAWFPPWLAVHLVQCQSFIVTQWKQYGQPAWDVTIQKAAEKKDQVEKFIEPHIVTIKTKWIPIIKERSLDFATNLEPHVNTLAARTVDIYHVFMTSVDYHLVEVQKVVNPYIQEAKKLTKPYIDQISTMEKPHVDAAHAILKPYTKKVHRNYRKFVKTTTTYHHQVQRRLHVVLKSHEFTKCLATKQFIWFMASFLMALPVFLLFKMASAIFCKKPKKRTRSSNTSHTRRRAKRAHHDN